MQHRGMRLAALCLLLGSGILAAFADWSSEQQLERLYADLRLREAAVDRLLPSVASIADIQRAYTESGQRDSTSFSRVSGLIDRITTDAAGLRASADAPANTQHLEEFWTALSALMNADGLARDRLAAGDEAGAADAVLVSARGRVTVLDQTLRAFRNAETDLYRQHRAAADRQSRLMMLGIGMLWAIGLITFALVPRRIIEVKTEIRTEIRTVSAPAPAVEIVPVRTEPPRVDLARVAAITSDLARMADPSGVSVVLERACGLLNARGAILWVGDGDDLVAAAAHGYDPAVLQRLRPIARTAENATAAAWRGDEVRIVAAEAGGHGAIVAPMPGPTGALGVLAAEVPAGTEHDDSVVEMAAIIAAHLGTALAVWSSGAASGSPEPESDRQAAAS